MTKDELKQEAEDKLDKWTDPNMGLCEGYCYSEVADFMFRFAEPREKRITDLEKENTELKDKLNNLSSVAEVRLANWQKCEKEKKELKALIKSEHDIEARKNNSLITQLTEAKELIEDIYDLIPSSHSDYYKDVMERARQFLKEVEK